MIADMVMDAARRRGSPYIPIRLQCVGAELAQRVVADEPAMRLKSMDPKAAYQNALRRVLVTGSSNELTLDTSGLSPAAIAEKIAAHIAQVRANV